MSQINKWEKEWNITHIRIAITNVKKRQHNKIGVLMKTFNARIHAYAPYHINSIIFSIV